MSAASTFLGTSLAGSLAAASSSSRPRAARGQGAARIRASGDAEQQPVPAFFRLKKAAFGAALVSTVGASVLAGAPAAFAATGQANGSQSLSYEAALKAELSAKGVEAGGVKLPERAPKTTIVDGRYQVIYRDAPGGAAPRTATAPPVQEVKAAPVEEESSGAGGFFTGISIVGAGALGAVVLNQNKEKEQNKAEYDAKILAERAVQESLLAKVRDAEAAVEEERRLAMKIKQEKEAAASTSARALQLEKESKESTAAAKAAADNALAAEQRVVSAMQAEAEAAEQAIEAERAAVYAARAEVEQLSGEMSSLEAALKQQTSIAGSAGKAAAEEKKAKKALQERLQAVTKEQKATGDALSSERSEKERLDAEAEVLRASIEALEQDLGMQATMVAKVGGEAMALRDAMATMKKETKANADALRAEADRIREQREEAQAEALYLGDTLENLRAHTDEVTAQLERERKETERLELSIQKTAEEVKEALAKAAAAQAALKNELDGKEVELKATKKELASNKKELASNKEELKATQGELSDAQSQLKSLEEELAGTKEILSEAKQARDQAAKEKEDLLEKVQALQNELIKVTDSLEGEQDKSAKTAKDLQQGSVSIKRQLASSAANQATMQGDLDKKSDELARVMVELKQKQAVIDETTRAREAAEVAADELRARLDTIVEQNAGGAQQPQQDIDAEFKAKAAATVEAAVAKERAVAEEAEAARMAEVREAEKRKKELITMAADDWGLAPKPTRKGP